jgi:hypothetical protein
MLEAAPSSAARTWLAAATWERLINEFPLLT